MLLGNGAKKIRGETRDYATRNVPVDRRQEESDIRRRASFIVRTRLADEISIPGVQRIAHLVKRLIQPAVSRRFRTTELVGKLLVRWRAIIPLEEVQICGHGFPRVLALDLAHGSDTKQRGQESLFQENRIKES